MDQEQRRTFVREHRTAIFGYNRTSDGPAMSIVYYVVEPDDTLRVSTMADRSKAHAVARQGKISLCVLDEQWPPTYLQVYCDAEVDTDVDNAGDLAIRIVELMAGRELDEATRPLIKQGAANEGRVSLRLRPYATFETPPRHVTNESDLATLSHWTSSSLAW